MKVMGMLTLAAALSAAAAPVRAAVLETAIGNVSVQTAPGGAFLRARAGMTVPEGAVIRTAANARAILRFDPTDLVRLSDRTEMKVLRLSLNQPGRATTFLALLEGKARAMLHRARRSSRPDFAIAAGSAVASVKGTDFEAERASAASPASTIRVDDGSVTVGTTKSDGLADVIAAFNASAIGTGGTVVGQGYQVTVNGEGPVPAPSLATPRTALELVNGTGRVTVTAKGVTRTIGPGEEVPSGARVAVTGGIAVLAGTKDSITIGEAAVFGYEGRVGEHPGDVQVVITMDSGGVTVESGGQAVALGPGQTSSFLAGTAPTGGTPVASTPPPSAAGAPGAAPSGPIASGPTLPTPSDSFWSAPAPGASGGESPTPPPPPDTVNQDITVVSPSAP